MLNGKSAALVMFWLTAVSFPSFAGEQGSPPLCPLPAGECAEVIVRRFAYYGFEVTRDPEGSGGSPIRLRAVKGSETLRVSIAAHSSGVSALTVESTRDNRPDPGPERELRAYLEGYSRGFADSRDNRPPWIPVAILSREAAVVCVKAGTGERPVLSSGFFADAKGRIVSTAKGLAGVSEITVVLDGGKEIAARIVRADASRDLALIETGAGVASFVPLEAVRPVLRPGLKLYSLGCPRVGQRAFHAGTVQGQIQAAGGFPIWAIRMEMLPGSSGSPVFDDRGVLAGMVKGRVGGSDSDGSIIPTEAVLDFLK